jgi:hypothetical protein
VQKNGTKLNGLRIGDKNRRLLGCAIKKTAFGEGGGL